MKNMKIQADIGLTDAITFGFELGLAFAIGYATGTYITEYIKNSSNKDTDVDKKPFSTLNGRMDSMN